MATIEEYLDYAELAQISYIDGLQSGMIDSGYTINGKSILEQEFSSKEAKDFAQRYEVLATSAEYGIGDVSSFDAVLFLDRDTGKKVLAIRGSQEVVDYIVDIGELALNGTIMTQTASLEQFYNALVDDNKIMATDTLDVTGHSLGGFLAQYFTMQHADVVNQTYTYNAPGYGGIKTKGSGLNF